MGLNNLVTVLARRRSGAWVLGGIAAVLEGVERFMSVPKRVAPPAARVRAARRDFFSIKRTQSELGYTYWVLQGHGLFASFELFDTWAEAMARAEARLAAAQLDMLALAL